MTNPKTTKKDLQMHLYRLEQKLDAIAGLVGEMAARQREAEQVEAPQQKTGPLFVGGRN